jgi:hypothetical protein
LLGSARGLARNQSRTPRRIAIAYVENARTHALQRARRKVRLDGDAHYKQLFLSEKRPARPTSRPTPTLAFELLSSFGPQQVSTHNMLISKNTNQAIGMSGLVALTLATACADEPASTPASGFDASVATSDSGVAAVPAADGGQCLTTQFGTGMQCTLPGGGFGYRMCTNGVPVGNCMSLLPEGGIASFLGEGGINSLLGEGGISSILGEGGLSQFLGEGGINAVLGDAAISLEAGAVKCPQGLECSTGGSALGLPISGCAEPGQTLPPMGCMKGQPCKIGTAMGSCQDLLGFATICLVPCN